MQIEIDKNNIHQLTEAVIGAIWIQWRSLGSFIETDRLANTMIDPEALLLISLTLRHRERRLLDVLVSWAKNGSKLLSLQRVKNLVGRYPVMVSDRLAEFAHQSMVEGNDFRWSRLASANAGPAARNQILWKAYPAIWHPAALLLRIRLGFGMGITPDLLSFLLSLRGEWTNASQISQAICYSPYSIRRVADDMASAHLIESTQVKPVKYRAKPEAWTTLFGIAGKIPIWCFWYQVYAFAAKIINSYESGEWEGLSAYMLSTKLRDLVEDNQDVFIWNQINIPDPRRYIGEEYLLAFNQTINNLTEWIMKES